LRDPIILIFSFPGAFIRVLIADLVIQFEKMAVNLCTSLNCMEIGHGSDSGIQGFRNLGIEGILSLLIY
jgi:hypothetical protein